MLKCTKFDFRWGSTHSRWGTYMQRSPDPLALFKGSTSEGKKWRKGREGEGRKGGKEIKG